MRLRRIKPSASGGGLVLGETSSDAYRGDRGAVAYAHSQVAHANVNATVNDTDANLRDRGTHTGTQAATTIVEDSTHRFATDAEKAIWNAAQASDADLTAIAGLSPTNDDVIQRKAGAWTNRTMSQIKTDLVLVKSDVGLGNVDNTSDLNKPISTATQTALDGKANVLGSDDNYVTDAEKVKLSNLSGTNTGDQTLPTRASLGLDTTDSPQFTGINLGHASDTTITRVSAGVIAVEGVQLATGTGTASGTNTGDNATNTQYSGLAASKQDTLVSATNIKTINGSSVLGSGNLVVSGAVAITEVEIDLGTTPVAEAIIAVADVTILPTTKIIGGLAYKAPTGKDLDELEMDAIELKFEPGTTTFNVYIKGLEGYLSDKFIIWYIAA